MTLGKIVVKKVALVGPDSLPSQLGLSCWDWPELQPLLCHSQALIYRIMSSAWPIPREVPDAWSWDCPSAPRLPCSLVGAVERVLAARP